MHARIALGLLLVLAACSPVAPPDSPPTPAPPAQDLPEAFRELQEAASKIQSQPVAPLVVVAEAAFVARALRRHDPATGAQEDGHHYVTWSDHEFGYSWTMECWPGYPVFPGSAGMDPCAPPDSPEVAMDEAELVAAAWRLIDAMGRRNGYNLLHADLQRDLLWDELEQVNYKMWFTDPAGTVWYWQWTKLAGFGQADPAGE